MDNACIKCGRCLSVCPVYKITSHERFSPRGKNDLIGLCLEGLLPNSHIAEAVNACILCGRCKEVCVLNIDTPEIIKKMRRRLWPEQKLHLYRSFITEKFLAFLQSETKQKVDTGIWWRLFALTRTLKFLPISFASRPFLSNIPTPAPKDTLKTKGTIAIFVGCGVNFIYPHLGEILLKLLGAMGFNVIVPPTQTCCGLMACSLGDIQTASRLAQQNISAFTQTKADIIITPCASCYHQLKIFSPYRQAGISPKVVELSQFLVNGGIETILKKVSSLNIKQIRTTWHDPCHLRFHHQIWEEPRQILRQTTTFVESSPEGQCCGHGGSFMLNFPELSERIFSQRQQAILKSNTKLVFTTCMGCLLQLQSHLGKQKARHLLEIFV